jgi:hypothetical protein
MDIDLDEQGDIVRLPVDYKAPPDGARMLVEVPYAACAHLRSAFEVDVRAGKCKCLDCQGEVSPMFVLERLMHRESQWMRTRAAYQDEMQRIAERERTKCQHCGQITRISHRR